VDPGQAVLLLTGGIGAGLSGSVGGLASLVSYPILLAVGMPPVAANVTNSVALLPGAVGAAAGSRPELRGQRARLTHLGALAGVGGIAGAVLLLNTPASAFERIVPVLIALGSVLLLLRDPIRRWADRRATPPPRLALAAAVTAIGVYTGYFGAAAGVLMLAALSASTTEPLAVTNAVKNIVVGAANLAAVVLYAVIAPIHWPAALLLGCGCLAGSWTGPAIVRRLPERPLRAAIGTAGLGLAAYLWLTAMR
jgi:uncharacterized membrane protein YfcA